MANKDMTVEELNKIVEGMPKDVFLRSVNKDKLAEYAEKMSAGVVFPPVIVGQWPVSEKYGSIGIPDGVHRIGAALVAGVKTLPVQTVVYKTVTDMLADMYARNMAHGLPVTEGQRNARIQLLRQQGMKLEDLASMFHLGKSSVDRIAKGAQGEGKSGPKKGANKSKGQKSQEPMKGKKFFSVLELVNYTLERVRAKADVIAYVIPETKEGSKVDGEKIEVIEETIENLQQLIKDINDVQ